MKASYGKWYRTHRAKFNSDEEWRAWNAQRRAQNRMNNPVAARASRMRHWGLYKQKVQQNRIMRDSLVTLAMIQRLRFNPPPFKIRVPRFKKSQFIPVILPTKTCAFCGSKHTRRQSPCCSDNCAMKKWRSENAEHYKATRQAARAHRKTETLSD